MRHQQLLLVDGSTTCEMVQPLLHLGNIRYLGLQWICNHVVDTLVTVLGWCTCKWFGLCSQIDQEKQTSMDEKYIMSKTTFTT